MKNAKVGPWIFVLGILVGVGGSLVAVAFLSSLGSGDAVEASPSATIASVVSGRNPTTTTITQGLSSTTPKGRACDSTLGPDDDLDEAIRGAAADSTLCLEDGTYGQVTVSAGRTSWVTVASANPLGAVFEAITFDDASFIAFEEVTVQGPISNLEDSTSRIRIAGSDLRGVFLDAPRLGTSAVGPNNWAIEYNDIRDCTSYCVALLSADPLRQAPITDVTIRGNRIGPMDGGEDAIRLHNWQRILIEDNEIFGVIEDGQHNDCLQSVWGGSGLVFQRNYLHDNNCQTFFIKNGYAQDVTFHDNLSLRNKAGDASVNGQVYAIGGFTMTRNTLWDSSPFYLRSRPHGGRFPVGEARDYEVSGNVLMGFIPLDDENGGAGRWATDDVLVEDFNVIGGGWTWVPDNMGAHSLEDADPEFVAMTESAADDLLFGDWRLTEEVAAGGETYPAGITWQLAGRDFGIAAFR